jgi:hypothetical protein
MAYWHHQTIKKNTVAILDLFNDMEVPRFSQDGELISSIKIPIIFGNRDKLFQHLDNTNSNLSTGNINSLPKMALTFDGMSKSPARDTNKLQKINRTSGTEIINFQFNPRAYDFMFTLNIATRTLTDMTIIVEQIAPLFRPTRTLYVKEIDIQEEASELTLEIGDFTFNLPDSLEESDIRIVECSLPITLRGNLYLPIKDTSIFTKFKLFLSASEISSFENKASGYGIEEGSSCGGSLLMSADDTIREDISCQVPNMVDCGS